MLLGMLLGSNTQAVLKRSPALGIVERSSITRSDRIEPRVEEGLHVVVRY